MGARGFPAACGRLVLLGLVLASCSGAATNHGADAAVVADLGDVNDLSPGPDQGTLDASGDDVLDATDDLPMEGGVDASTDRSEVFVPTADVWAGVPLLDLGGILIPVDPNAVPAPGSECVGDGGVRAGDPTIAPPRPVRPLSVSRVTSQRPTFQWILSEGTTGARVEVCADRCCTRVIQTLDAEGTTVRPTTALPPGVVFWRIFGRRAGVVGSRASYTWEFEVRRRDAPHDTSWGTIRDFNGDGFDDLMMFRPQTPGGSSANLLLVQGSTEGLHIPVSTGVVARRVPGLGMVGDFNGDGLADVAWRESDRRRLPVQSWFETAVGSSGPMRSSAQPDFGMLGPCVELNSGSSVDWNGDGYSDIIVSVIFGCELALPPDASVLLGYYGSSSGFAVTPQWALRLDGRFAHRLVYVNAGVGDLNNDGYGDIFVVSSFSGAGTSSIPAEHAILFGTSSGEPRIERVPQPASSPRGWADGRPASIGDIDGDGRIDLLISLNYSNPLYIYRNATGLGSPTTVLADPFGGTNFGFSYSHGDVNGDGLSDVIVSSELAYTMERDGVPFNVGRVYVFPGPIVVPTPIIVERSSTEPEDIRRQIFGTDPMSPGDVNGDGIDDLVVGDTLHSRLCVRAGRVGFASGSPDACMNDVRPLVTEWL
jgi:hypothetical protein